MSFRIITLLRSNPENCLILGCASAPVDKSSDREYGQSRDMSALKRWFELMFGFRMRFIITSRKISGGKEHLWVCNGVHAFPVGCSVRNGGAPGGVSSGVKPIV